MGFLSVNDKCISLIKCVLTIYGKATRLCSAQGCTAGTLWPLHLKKNITVCYGLHF